MGALLLLGQLLTLSNALAPTIASLVAQLKTDNPDLTEDQIIEKAMAAALETRQIAGEDRGPQA